ncbi:hypothetical protein HYT45_03270 [Candidatus Uhrbacteria bacterium]|nr:hypothetical protein [Candidatus Uhrbacteria bacterium]
MPGFLSHPSGQMFFKIPNNSIMMSYLIEAVPNEWRCVFGHLCASRNLIEMGRALQLTGISLDGGCQIVGGYDANGKPANPNIYSMALLGMMPGFVDFRVHTYGRGSIADIKNLAIGLVVSGYRGSLLFGKSTPDDDNEVLYIDPYAAACSLELAPWNGHPNGNEPGEQPARIKLWWNKSLEGKKDDIWPIARICQKLRLEEYTP